MAEKIIIVRIRGIRNMEPKIKHTLMMLRLNKPNHCVVVDATPQTLGMINIVKDYVAYGKTDEKLIAALAKKKGDKEKVFCLHPPRKGLKDIKKPYPQGDLGERKDINDLIRRMM